MCCYANLLHSPRKVTVAFKRENTLFLKARFVIKITTMRPVFLGSVLRAKLYVLANISIDERVSRDFVCKRHGKFIKSHNSGFKRSIKMIETGKHSAFRGTICNKDCTMRRVFLSTILLRANGIFFFVNISR